VDGPVSRCDAIPNPEIRNPNLPFPCILNPAASPIPPPFRGIPISCDGASSLAAVQPFGMVQMGKGWYLRSTGVWAFNLEADSWMVPFGMGIGKVVKAGKNVINAFIEPQFTILSSGDAGQPQLQILFGVNIQSMK